MRQPTFLIPRRARIRALSAPQLALLIAIAAAASGCGSDETVVGDVSESDGLAQDAQSDGTASADTGNVAGDSSDGADSGASVDTSQSDTGQVDTGEADTGPAVCDDASACDDKRSCTADDCSMPGRVCSWLLLPGNCLIGGICYANGDVNPGNACEVCNTSKTTKDWSDADDGKACEDGKTCTVDGACTAGACQGKPLMCGDDNACTGDVCVQGLGCTYPALLGSEACDDGDACTSGDSCTEGQCLGTAVNCNDNEPCTADACDGKTGCSHTALTASDATPAPCSDDDACTEGDACKAGACVAGGAANCDDGNACTLDACDTLAGCAWLPTQNPCCTGLTNICDDGDPCTTDLCDPGSGSCATESNTAICNDGSACTTKDTCNQGACKGTTLKCDDGSPCTADACDPKKGCVFSPTGEGKPCDDGDVCSKGDACTAGKCVGQGGCACTPVFSETVAKVTSLQIGKGGKPGEGLDLDGDPKTCAPSTSCSGGIDNALGSIAGLVNNQLIKPVDEGSIMLLVELIDFKQGPISMAIHQGKLDPSNASCDITKGGCNYTADPALIDLQTCKPKAALAGKVVGSTITAGGKGTIFPLSLPLQAGIYLELTLYDLELQGTITVTGKTVATFEGILAGAVPKAQLLKAIDALPDEGLPLPKSSIKTLLDSTVEVDIDADGDGTKESSSISLKVIGVSGLITGTTKP